MSVLRRLFLGSGGDLFGVGVFGGRLRGGRAACTEQRAAVANKDAEAPEVMMALISTEEEPPADTAAGEIPAAAEE